MRRFVLLGLLLSAASCGTDEPPAPVMRNLTVVPGGQGTGAITSSSGGLACTSTPGTTTGTCSIEVQDGTSLTLTATPAAGSRFTTWGNACTSAGAASTCTLTIDEATQVGATFDLIPVLTLTTTVLPDGEQAQPYSVQLQATGGTPPYAWSIVAGTLPPPLQLDPATGTITGTPTASGTVQVTVRVTAGAATAERQFTLVIAPPPVVITTATLPGGRVGQPYSLQLTASGGTGTYVWSLASGTPPPGIQLSASGLLSGTPTAAGSSSFTVRASSGSRSVDQALTLLIEPGPPVIATTTLRGGAVGAPYGDTLRATGGNGTFAWTVTAGTLPTGLALQSATGVVVGLPQVAGNFQFTVQVVSAGQSASRTFTIAIIDAPLIAEVNCTGAITGFAGNYPDCTPLFQVTLPGGALVAGATVNFSPGGGSTIARATGVTDASGRVVAPAWRLGPAATNQQLQAQIGPSVVLVQATAIAVPASQYQVVVRFVGNQPTPAQVAAFTAAAQRWSQVIVGDVPLAFAAVPASADGCYPALNESIDDVVIYARVAPIDGPGGILGQAGPRLIRSSLIPAVGCMTFDEADLQSIEAGGTLNTVILHEMGHVLGIGGMWPSFGLVQGAGGPDPVFLGLAAAVSWIGARPSATPWTGLLEPVPVENSGGAGTRDSHWRESIFTNELMTGFVSGPVNPLSAITAASLRDLGYVVNDAASDPYTVAAGLRAGKGSPKELRELPFSGPIGILGQDGRVTQYVQPGDLLSPVARPGRVDLMRRIP